MFSGPDFLKSSQESPEDQEENGRRESPGPSNRDKKNSGASNHLTDLRVTTSQQKSAQKFILKLLKEVDGDHFSLTEALPLINHLQTKVNSNGHLLNAP